MTKMLDEIEKRIADNVLAKLDFTVEDRASAKIQELLKNIDKLK